MNGRILQHFSILNLPGPLLALSWQSVQNLLKDQHNPVTWLYLLNHKYHLPDGHLCSFLLDFTHKIQVASIYRRYLPKMPCIEIKIRILWLQREFNYLTILHLHSTKYFYHLIRGGTSVVKLNARLLPLCQKFKYHKAVLLLNTMFNIVYTCLTDWRRK